MAHITIGDITPRIQYTGNASVTVFAFPFPIFENSDLLVYLDTTLQDSGYTVSGAGESDGGSVTFSSAPGSGVVVTLARSVPIERTTDFQDGGAFRAAVINEELDRIVAIEQQVKEELGRAVKRPQTSTSAASLDLPDPVAGRALVFGSDGAITVSDGDPDAAQAAAQSAKDDAEAAALAAETAKSQAEAARDATLTAFDNFDDRYLGDKASDPTTDNDGNALVAGALYFNSVSGIMKVYTGSVWVAAYVAGSVGIPITVITGTTSISSTELGKCILSASGNTVSLQHTTVAGDVGGWVEFINLSTTLSMTITKTSGATVYSAQGTTPFTLPPKGRARASVTSAGVWVVDGTGLCASASDLAAKQAAIKYMHVRDEKATNTAGGAATAAAWNTRTLNTVVSNDITGASLASNIVTLPAGTYKIRGIAPCAGTTTAVLSLYNVTTSARIDRGPSVLSTTTNINSMTCEVARIVTFAVETQIRLDMYAAANTSANSLGVPLNVSGVVEVYAEMFIEKVA